MASETSSLKTASSSGESGANFASSDKAERDLGQSDVDFRAERALAAGITAETAGRGIAELAAWRDRFLVDLLALRAGQKYRAPNDHVVVVSQG